MHDNTWNRQKSMIESLLSFGNIYSGAMSVQLSVGKGVPLSGYIDSGVKSAPHFILCAFANNLITIIGQALEL